MTKFKRIQHRVKNNHSYLLSITMIYQLLHTHARTEFTLQAGTK
jgi:hypothetical protein